MMCYNRYDVNFVFGKGTNLHLADTLSKAHMDSVEGNQDDRAQNLNINAFADIPGKRLDKIREATLRDANLQTAVQLVLEGWPRTRQTQYSLLCFTVL